ncbi:outer membrane protein assembly factor BamB family protein [Streptomyces purpureus]|uniref:Pyrrolo-quinoline quinone repeat domain-containing protein n=1 Tax=Streptomyces purpureus TaxID=1951 RepID=A0A918LQ75_9ACTN|nr:PQQ-binding-like beta-propeller repeat protein [Streptomyces purpureus]GGT34647.1 hypothetical protein GCM10014713_30310 [Streptomyces purpureus]
MTEQQPPQPTHGPYGSLNPHGGGTPAAPQPAYGYPQAQQPPQPQAAEPTTPAPAPAPAPEPGYGYPQPQAPEPVAAQPAAPAPTPAPAPAPAPEPGYGYPQPQAAEPQAPQPPHGYGYPQAGAEPQPGYGYPHPQTSGPAAGPAYDPFPGLRQDPDAGPGVGMEPEPGPGPERRRRRPFAVIAAVVAALLVISGGTWYALDMEGGDGPAGAKPSQSASPTAPPGPDTATADKINQGRTTTDAKMLWLRRGGVDLPRDGADVFGPWFSKGTVTTALHRTVTSVSATTGKVKWSLPLDSDICQAATHRSGTYIAVATKEGPGSKGDCRRVRGIDLATGKQLWEQKVPDDEIGEGIDSSISMAVTRTTLVVGRANFTTGYKIADGKQLFGRTSTGNCQPYRFAGGSRLLAVLNCPGGAARKTRQEQIQELDPETGKPRWTHQLAPDDQVRRVFSVKPVVVALHNATTEKYTLLALDKNGKKRSAAPLTNEYRHGCSQRVADATNVSSCQVAANAGYVYMATEPAANGANQIVVIDLDNGKVKRRISAPAGRVMMPMEVSDAGLMVRLEATAKLGGAVALAPFQSGAPRILLQLPAATAPLERGFQSPVVTYDNDRYTLVNGTVAADSDAEERTKETLMAFGK